MENFILKLDLESKLASYLKLKQNLDQPLDWSFEMGGHFRWHQVIECSQ
jgi:hypothetical protein